MVGVTEFDPEPPTVALLPAMLAGLLALVVTTASSGIALAVGGPGAALLTLGGRNGNRRLVTIGGTLLFAGVVLAGATGLQPSVALAAGVLAAVAYDTGEHAVTLGYDVGRQARVTQNVAVHAVSSLGFASVVAGVAYAIYEFGPASLPVTGLLALLAAGVLLAYSLRE